MKYDKIIVGDFLICIKNDYTNDNLITVNKEYKVLEIGRNYSTITIMTDVGIICDIIFYSFFISKRILRKNKLNKLNKIFCELD